jgi:hypothetical protein
MVEEARKLSDELSMSETDEKTTMAADRGYFSVESMSENRLRQLFHQSVAPLSFLGPQLASHPVRY